MASNLPKGDLTVSLGDIIDFCQRYCWLLLSILCLGALVGFASTYLLKKQWEAKTVVQVGQIYTGNGPSVQIEPTARAMERVRLAPFLDAVIQRLKLPVTPGADANADLIRASANVTLNRGADLLELSVRGASRDDAQRFLTAFEDELIEIHAALSKPSVDRMQKEMADVKAAIGAEQQRKTKLEFLASRSIASSGAGKFSESVLLSELVQQNESQIRTFQLRKSALEEQMDPQRTFNTRPLGAVAVGRRPAFPRKLFFVVGGAVLGLSIAIAIGLYTEVRRRKAG